MEPVGARHLLFVVGMHRSGTSALCAALQACGASFGDDLLEPMESVNERGFWESAEVVDLNDRILHCMGASWYDVGEGQLSCDWSGSDFEPLKVQALALLKRGFGNGLPEVIKDPRLCITLDFWLRACEDSGLPCSAVVMSRNPMEVCKSLEKRDGFPVGYCLRLLRTYLRGIAAKVPADTIYLAYERLLSDPLDTMRELAEALPLELDAGAVADAISIGLKHQHTAGEAALPSLMNYASIDFAALDREIEALAPLDLTLSEFARGFAQRGRELTSIGEQHCTALETIELRDRQLAGLAEELDSAVATVALRDEQIADFDKRINEIGALHAGALEIINQRDKQVRELDSRLQDLGGMHSNALEVIDERDQQLSELNSLHNAVTVELRRHREKLERLSQVPVFGRLARKLWNREPG